MSDERLVEVMAEGMHNANHCPSDGPGTWLPEAAAALAALRDAGFEVYRPEEWPEVVCFPDSNAGRIVDFDGQNLQVVGEGTTFAQMPRRGRYRLVPISGETLEESEQ